MKFSYPSNLSKKIDFKQKMCTHISSGPKTISYQRAMVYLKLREDGCMDKEALTFASKNICMSDASLRKDGPANFRKLKVKQKMNQMTVNGWLNVPLEYEMGKKYINGKHEIISESELEKKMIEKMREADNVEKKKFHQKIERLNKFLKKNKKRYKFNGLSKEKLLEKLRDLNKKNSYRNASAPRLEEEEKKDAAGKELFFEIGSDDRTVKVDNELMKFTSYIYDLSSANFKEESLYFQDKSHLNKDYTNRSMSSKIKDFKEIQDEFNTANYVYKKLDPEDFKISDKDFLRTKQQKYLKKIAIDQETIENVIKKAHESFYYGQGAMDPAGNVDFEKLNRLKATRDNFYSNVGNSKQLSRVTTAGGGSKDGSSQNQSSYNGFFAKKSKSMANFRLKKTIPKRPIMASFDPGYVSRIFNRRRARPNKKMMERMRRGSDIFRSSTSTKDLQRKRLKTEESLNSRNFFLSNKGTARKSHNSRKAERIMLSDKKRGGSSVEGSPMSSFFKRRKKGSVNLPKIVTKKVEFVEQDSIIDEPEGEEEEN